MRRNGETLLEKECGETHEEGLTDRSCLSIEGIADFAESVDPEDVREILERQIAFNMAIAEEGLRGNYGANIGRTVLRGREYDINYMMRAYAAAASDARMNGCELPVVINSGSGNQGITASVPVIVYARENGIPHADLPPFRRRKRSAPVSAKVYGTGCRFCCKIPQIIQSGGCPERLPTYFFRILHFFL